MQHTYHKNPIAIAVALLGAFLLPATVQAQECSAYYPFREGVRMEYTMYNDKDKVEGTQWQEVTGVSETSEGLEATMNMGFSDDKGKNTFESSYGLTCTGSAIRIDYESLISGPMMEQYQDMEMDISGTDLELPNNLSEGMELPDANVTMKMKMSGINMNMQVDMTNRRVEKKETVSTPAGDFDCYVIYSESHSKMMMANQTFPQRTWLSEGVGMVKTESYNKKGKLVSRMVLTSITR
ncbi:hypothetical protein [Robiginitalea sp. SC105]|uniref:TapB family protein n=1 Tax=Robiginitalea sp. SC105 TaxID=2762332 RepID=UPI00163B1AC4|nr:hypothetical protein [Robiginitalea sp. SC105]MBC2837708.1 hypothetical protein [Robiginitalea sp. SC105]